MLYSIIYYYLFKVKYYFNVIASSKYEFIISMI